METIRKGYSQFTDLYEKMAPSQRITLLVVPILILGAFAFLLFQGSTGSYTALSYGKVFTIDELHNAEQALVDAGMTDFRTEGRRILVPANDVERYNAALLQGGALPTNWAEEWEKNFDKTNIFTSERQLKTMRDIALAKELSRMIQAVPEIAQASVIWARSENKPTWNSAGRKVTANVNVLPRQGREITSQLVQSLRAAVASMVPDLKPGDVTIFDQATGTTHVPSNPEEAFDMDFIKWVKQHTQGYQDKINSHLSYIPNVVVSVNVDVDNLKARYDRTQEVNQKETVSVRQSQSTRNQSSTQKPVRAEPGQVSNAPRSLQMAMGNEENSTLEETNRDDVVAPSFTVSEKVFLPAMPTSVQVSVAVPEAYYEAIAKQRGMVEGESPEDKQKFRTAIDQLKLALEEDIKAQVLKLLPATSTADSVDVTSFVPIDREIPEVQPSWMQTATAFLGQWGSSLVLGVIVLTVLFVLSRNKPKEAEVPRTAQMQQPGAVASAEEAAEELKPKPVTKRDHIQTVVKDNPEMTAALISKWLESAT